MAKPPTSRIDKLLSSLGYGSRSQMAQMAKAGGITLDGADVTDVSQRIAVTPDLPTRMQVDGEPLDPLPGVVILLNKPLGMTCSHKEEGPLVYDLLPRRWRGRDPAISTVGRLDKQTSGLLLMTDDGDLLQVLGHALLEGGQEVLVPDEVELRVMERQRALGQERVGGGGGGVGGGHGHGEAHQRQRERQDGLGGGNGTHRPRTVPRTRRIASAGGARRRGAPRGREGGKNKC